MGARTDRAGQLAQLLLDAGVPAVASVQQLGGLLPAVLIGPPVIDYAGASYAGPLVTWSLHAVASTVDGDQAWHQIDELVHDVASVLVLTRADPTAYALGDLTLPAYTMTYTETVED